MAAQWLQTQKLPTGTACDYNVTCQMDERLSTRLGHLQWNDHIDSMEHTWVEQPTGICAFLYKHTQTHGTPRIITDLRDHRTGNAAGKDILDSISFYGIYLAGNGDGVATTQVAGAAKVVNTGDFPIFQGETVVAYVGDIPLRYPEYEPVSATILSEQIATIFLTKEEREHGVFAIGTALESREAGGYLSVALNRAMYMNK